MNAANRHLIFALLLNLLLCFGYAVQTNNAANPVHDGYTFVQYNASGCNVFWTYIYQPTGNPVTYFDVQIVDEYNPSVILWSGRETAVVGTATSRRASGVPLQAGMLVWIRIFAPDGAQMMNITFHTHTDCETNDYQAAPPPCHTDGRLDPLNCAAPVALYLNSDEDSWFLQVWLITSASEGVFLFDFYQEDLSELSDEPIALAQMGDVTLYLLPTGELQVNAPYLGEPSKFYVFIFEVPSGIGYHQDIQAQ
jgi:hypothetical protein